MDSGEIYSELLQGWSIAEEQRTRLSLGDRSTYVGLSDASKAFGCFRAAVMSKVYPATNYPSVDTIVNRMSENKCVKALEKVRTLERGHEQEHGLASAFMALGHDFLRQLEIRVEYGNTPIRAHLDFTVFRPDITQVLESKSNNNAPESLYVEYEAQLYGQIGLLFLHRNDSVFSLYDAESGYVCEDRTLDQIVQENYGRKAPEMVEGHLLSMSADAVQTYGPYYPNVAMTTIVVNKAVAVWEKAEQVRQGIISPAELEYARGFHPLCEFCSFNAECPKFVDAEYDTQFAATLFQLEEVKKRKVELENLEKALKSTLIDAYEGRKLQRDWIQTGFGRFRYGDRTRRSLDQEALNSRLQQDFGMTEEQVTSLFQDCTKATKFKQLDVSKINMPPA